MSAAGSDFGTFGIRGRYKRKKKLFFFLIREENNRNMMFAIRIK